MIKLIAKLLLLFIAIVALGVLWQRAQLSALALSRIDPVVETRQLVAEERFAEAAEYLDFFLDYPYVQQDPEAVLLRQEIETVRGSLSYQAGKLGEGLWSGTSDETVGQVAGVVTDFFVIGDLRDLTKQGIQWARGEETDEVIAALATIGVVASAAQLASGAATVGTAGAAAPSAVAATAVKGGTTVLKAARKLGKLPPWLGKSLVKSAKTVKQSPATCASADSGASADGTYNRRWHPWCARCDEARPSAAGRSDGSRAQRSARAAPAVVDKRA